MSFLTTIRIFHNRSSTFPIHDAPYTLTRNCRNTDKIHDAVYLFYKGQRVDPPHIDGHDIVVLPAPSIAAQAQKLHSKIAELISRDGISSADIVVLVADSLRKSDYYEELPHRPLPKPAKWLEEGSRTENTVVVDTVKRFKGLESSVVFLWGLDSLIPVHDAEVLYVGMSRAKSLLYIVATRAMCQQVTGRR